MSLRDRTIHELRTIAETLGVSDLFSKTQEELIIAIDEKGMAKAAPAPLPEPEPLKEVYSTRKEEIIALLKPYTDIGMHLLFNGDTWTIKHNKREDSGHFSTINRVLISCAKKVMQ